MKSRLHAFLAGSGSDARGRSVEDVLAMSDADLERHHDYIQWLFPLPAPSAAVPGSPFLSPDEIDTIRSDPAAQEILRRGSARMIRFYSGTDHWLTAYDHNHLRITRIIQSLKLLLGTDASGLFYKAVMERQKAAGSPVNKRSLGYWREALGESRDEDE